MESINSKSIPFIAGTLLLLLLVIFIIAFVVLYNKAQLKFKLEKQKFQEELLKIEIEIREQTQNNVSRELHDNLGQIASLIKINLAQLAITLPYSNKQRIDSSIDLVQQLIADIKNVSSSLHNNQISKLGLSTAIKQDCERINKLGLLKIQFIEKTNHSKLDTNSSLFLYRMYQEALNNILSHSKATDASVELTEDTSAVTLRIHDNGSGFSLEKPSKGNGIKNLKERCRIIGATLSIKSTLSKGTEIIINYPIPHESKSFKK